MLFVLFNLLIKVVSSNENCLLFESPMELNSSNCLMCKNGFYNRDFDNPEIFHQENCVTKIADESPDSSRIVYVASRPSEVEILRGKYIIYGNFLEALYLEDIYCSSRILFEKKVHIKLMKGDHYILPKDVKNSFTYLFVRNKVDVTVAPLFCSEAPADLSELCLPNDKIPTIFIKFKFFSIFISYKFTIKNLRINGIDMLLFENGDSCSNELKICCLESVKNCYPKSYTYNPLDKNNMQGLFNLEPIIDDCILELPTLTLENVQLEELLFTPSESIRNSIFKAFPLAFILISDFQGGITVNNSQFKKVFFPGGLIIKIEGIRNIYKTIENFIDWRKHEVLLESNIILSESIISEYKNLQISNFTANQSGAKLAASIFSFKNFKGNFSLTSNQIIKCFIADDGLLSIRNGLEFTSSGVVTIRGNIISGNTFLIMMLGADNYNRKSLEILFWDNSLQENNMLGLCELTHIRNFTLRGQLSPPFQLPISFFIRAAYSNLLVNSLIFRGYTSNIALYHLIQITSVYEATYDTVFTISKRTKGLFFSNETVIFRNVFIQDCSILMYSSMNLNYYFGIEDSVFDNLRLEPFGGRPFIELVSEKLVSLTNVTFSSITTKSDLIAVLFYLNVTINQLNLFNITITDGHLLRFYSNTACNPSEHQFNLTSVSFKRVSIYLTNENLGKFLVGIIYSHSTESGKCSSARLNDFQVENIIYNKPHSRHQILIFDSSLMTVINLKAFNISNAILLSYRSQVATGTLLLKKVTIENPQGFLMTRLFDCGQTYYAKAELFDSRFFSGNLTFNKAGGLNLAQTLVISNVSFCVFQETGTVLFAQPSKISFIFIKNLSIKTLQGSQSTLLIIITELQEANLPWSQPTIFADQIRNGTFAFGIENSSFESSFESAIVLLVQTQLLFKNCLFKDMIGKEGAVLKISQNSKVILFKTNISNAYSQNMGGSMLVENSALILLEVSLQNSSSKLRGGMINSVESEIILSQCYFFNSSSTMGGMIFADTSTIIIFSSIFKKAFAGIYGSLIVLKQGTFNVSDSVFKEGTSTYFGGAIYLEAATFFVNATDFISCITGLGTIYALNSAQQKRSSLENTRFLENSAIEGGTIIYSSDVNIYFKSIEIQQNSAQNGYLFIIFGSFFKPNIEIEILRVTYNKAKKGLFSVIDSVLSIKYALYKENTFESQIMFHAAKSNIIIEANILFIQNNNSSKNLPKTDRPLIIGRSSSFSLSGSIFSLAMSSSLLDCLSCSSIYLLKSYFFAGRGKLGAVFHIFGSQFSAHETYFKNNEATLGGVIHSSDSNISLEHSCFLGNKADVSGSVLFSVDTEKEIKAFGLFVYSSLFNKLVGNGIDISNVNAYLNNSNFFGPTFNVAGNQVFKILGGYLILVEHTRFQYFMDSNVLQISESRKIIVAYCYFTNVMKNNVFVRNLGAEKIKFAILFTYFSNSLNPEDNGGFVKALGNLDLTVDSSNFFLGRASQGGALFLSCLHYICRYSISNSHFQGNTADKAGGAIKVDTNNLDLVNTTFLENFAPVGIDVSYSATKLRLFMQKEVANESAFNSSIITDVGSVEENYLDYTNKLIGHVSGDNVNFWILITDKNDNIQKYENGFQVKLEITNNYSQDGLFISFSNNRAEVKNGVAFFENTIIVGTTNRTFEVDIKYDNGNAKISETLIFQFLPCGRGHSYQDYRCSKCPENFYSLASNPENGNVSCSPCPENSHCPGGDIIIPAPNYWRRNANTSLIIECKISDGCISQGEDLFRTGYYAFACQKGYEGHLCSLCSEGFGKIKTACVSCESSKSLFIGILLSGYLIYFIYIDYKERKCVRPSTDNGVPLLRILTNYLSIFVLITAMDVKWSDSLNEFFIISSTYANTSPSSVFSLDCFFSSSNAYENFDQSIIFLGVFPLFISFFQILNNLFKAFIIYIFKAQRRNEVKKFFKRHLNISWLFFEFTKHLVFIYMNVYPHIHVSMFKLLGCQKLDDFLDESYLIKVPWIRCYSDQHQAMLYRAVPIFIVWVCLVPFLIFYLVKKWVVRSQQRVLHQKANFINFDQSHDKKLLTLSIENNKLAIINLITRGYKKKYFLWEAVIYFRKILFLFIAGFSKEIDMTALGGLTILFLTLFTSTTLILKPFEEDQLNILEEFSLLISTMIIGLGVINSYKEELQVYFRFACIISLMSLHFLFIAVWAILFLRNIAKKINTIISLRTKKSTLGKVNGSASSQTKINLS